MLPDGCVEMIINVGAHFTRHCADGTTETQPRELLVGPTTRHMTIAPSGEIRLVGVRFQPGGALPFLSVAPGELRDAAPPLADVAPPFEPHLAAGLTGHAGRVTYPAVASELGYKLQRVEEAITE